MPSKEFLCKKCGDMHKRPINSKCPFVDAHVSSESEIEKSPIASGGPGLSDNNDLNLQILAELKSLGGRMTAMEQKMLDTNSTEVSQRSPATAVSPAADSLAQMDVTVVVPSVAVLQGAPHIQAEVDRRIKHLTDLNESGKLKSQRGGNDTVFVKRQVPWPQNFVLGGNNKSRISYDNLSWCQWVSGFAMIAREEGNVDTKNAMLDYLSEIMEDANDFSWQSAKASHAVLLCRMEEGKVEWSETTKLIGLGVLMCKDFLPKIISPIRSPNLKQKQLFVAFTRGPCANIKKTMKLGVLFTSMCVPPVLLWEKSTSIWPKIVVCQ